MKKRLFKIAFYKKSKSFFGGLIRFQQKWLQGLNWEHSQYSHAEVVFCDLTKKEKHKINKIGLLNYKNYQIKLPVTVSVDIKNVFFSSSECDGGVRFKIIEPKKEHWDFVEIGVTEKQYADMLKKAISLNGKKYGLAGIFFAQFLNKNFSGKNSYFCSQIVSIILSAGFGNKFSETFFSKYTHFINPAKLHKRILSFLKKI